jgi:serine/threonine-protein kinase
MSGYLVRSFPLSEVWGEPSMTNSSAEQAAGQLPRSLYGFEVIDFLGEGAGSMIYAATDPITAQLYALKHVVVKKEKDQRFIEQLVTEYEVGSKIIHPLLRRSVDLKMTKPLLRKVTEAALVMELFEGVSCELRPPATVAATAAIFRQTAEALGAMHAQGYIHCDLKPNNILVASDGRVKVIDLGQACAIGSVKKRIQGTPDFIAPEQVRCEPLSVQTDVYNLGATFYWMLSGRKLPTLFTLKKSKNSFLVANSIPAPHELNQHVPENLSHLVMECVRIPAAKRPDSMSELCNRLDIIKHTLAPASDADSQARARSSRLQ